jgi:acyl-coenzyme A thioesterase 9
MDYIASTVSYNYILPNTGATMVTAMVDNINFFEKISADQDLEIQGYVTHVGNSSIEVYIDVM